MAFKPPYLMLRTFGCALGLGFFVLGILEAIAGADPWRVAALFAAGLILLYAFALWSHMNEFLRGLSGSIDEVVKRMKRIDKATWQYQNAVRSLDTLQSAAQAYITSIEQMSARSPATPDKGSATLASNLDGVKREQYKLKLLIEEMKDNLGSEVHRFGEALETLEEGTGETKRLRDELSEKRQEVGNAVRRIGDWEKVAIDFLQSLERSLSNDNLNSDYRRAFEKATKDFCRFVQPLGLDLVRPVPNDPFDDRCSVAIEEVNSNGIEPGHVVECKAWGFRRGDHVFLKSKVVIAAQNRPTL